MPVINWGVYGVQGVTSDYRQAGYRTFSQLSDAQRTAVLKTLGYLPLYNFDYSDARVHQTIDGVPTDQSWTPDWAANSKVIEFVPVAGLNDKYVRMPKDAAADVLRVVSQGAPLVGSEKVGSYRDRALTQYIQDRSATVDQFGNVDEPLPSPGESLFRQLVKDLDGSPARWSVDYVRDGVRLFTINDGRFDEGMSRNPTWSWQDAGRENGVTDAPTGRAATIPGTSGTRRNISVPVGYRSELASVTGETFMGSSTQAVGETLVYSKRRYGFDSSRRSFGSAHGVATGAGGKLPEIRTQAQNSAAAAAIGGEGAWIGLYKQNGNFVYYLSLAPLSFSSWQSGEPNGQSRVFMKPNGTWWDDNNDWSTLIEYSPKAAYIPRLETYRNYNATWSSISTDVFDQRLTLDYFWTTNTQDVFGKRERYETVPTDVTVVSESTVTRWGAQPIREAQTTLVAGRINDPQLIAASQFAADAISAVGAVRLQLGGNATLSGRILASSDLLEINAAGSIVVEGRLADGQTSANAEPALAVLQTPAALTLWAGGTIHVGTHAKLQTIESDDFPAGSMTIESREDAKISGLLTSAGGLSVVASGNLELDGVMDSGASISLLAGTGDAGSGSITATDFADITANDAMASIILQAGETSGSILLSSGTIFAGQSITITSPAGRISHGPGGYIEAQQVSATAMSGISGRTRAPELLLESTGDGGIQIFSLIDVRVEATTANGGIDITARGNLDAATVSVGGTSPSNRTSLRALPGSISGPVTLTLGQLTTCEAADLVLSAEGPVVGLGDLVAASPTLNARKLTLRATVIPDLNVDADEVDVTVLDSGSLSITQHGERALIVSVSLSDGGLTVSNTHGSVELANILLATNSDQNDLSVTAAGDITIGRISAGLFYASQDDIPDLYSDTEAGIHSLGDIQLNSGGVIRQNTADSDVDIIGDSLWLRANPASRSSIWPSTLWTQPPPPGQSQSQISTVPMRQFPG